MLQEDFLAAALPLFSNDEVEILEWSPDIGWATDIPEWADELLNFYSSTHSLYGHGVNYSPLSADWTAVDDKWIAKLKRELDQRQFVHFSEHFGFSRIGMLQEGAPLPVPYTAQAVAAGQIKLAKLAQTTGGRIGLENLALAFSLSNVKDQGSFLDQLLEPFDGFILLDLHNLYCQLENFEISAEELLSTYPADRVREIHISGGSWSQSIKKKIRRDTHDNEVPDEVLAILPLVLAKCPNIEAVIFERLGGTMPSAEQQHRFRDDFRTIAKLIEHHWLEQNSFGDAVEATKSIALAEVTKPAELGAGDFPDILRYQKRLMELLQSGQKPEEIIEELGKDSEGKIGDSARLIQPRMIAVGQELVAKWTR